jgi:hypothetical protein
MLHRAARVVLGRQTAYYRCFRHARERIEMAVAYVQEFTIVDGDTSTANYDAVVGELNLQDGEADGLLVHTAGFDHEKGVFRIFDVWESREAGQLWIEQTLNPILERMMAAAPDPSAFTPPTADYWYELHDTLR